MPRCKICKEPYIRVRPMSPTCEKFECKVAHAEKSAAKHANNRLKADKKSLAVRKQAAKRPQDLLDEAQAAVNRYARIRDRDDGCISCDKPATWDGQWHGSHYRSVGACSALRFNVFNINKACSQCNRNKGGNIFGYTPKLIAKYGQEKVDWLKTQNKVTRYSREYLVRIKKIFNKRAARLERKYQAS